MTAMVKLWDDVASALPKAVSITWDGCHKIYVHMDKESHDQSVRYGYDTIPVTDVQESLDTLRNWYDRACGLRFITAIYSNHGDPNDDYVSLIPQFAESE